MSFEAMDFAMRHLFSLSRRSPALCINFIAAFMASTSARTLSSSFF